MRPILLIIEGRAIVVEAVFRAEDCWLEPSGWMDRLGKGKGTVTMVDSANIEASLQLSSTPGILIPAQTSVLLFPGGPALTRAAPKASV